MRFGKPRGFFLAMVVTLLMTIAPEIQAQITILSGRTLKKTTFEVNSVGSDFPGCSTANCTSIVTLFPSSNVVCPATAGGTCTYYILVESALFISTNAEGFYQIVVDGMAPSPGPPPGTINNQITVYAVVSLQSSGLHGSSYAVVAKVKNTTASQSHSVVVNAGCYDVLASGSCTGTVEGASLRVDVFQPFRETLNKHCFFQ